MLPLGHVRHARRDQLATVLMLTCAGGYTYAVKFCNGLICLSRFVCHGAVRVDRVLFTVLVDYQNPDEGTSNNAQTPRFWRQVLLEKRQDPNLRGQR